MNKYMTLLIIYLLFCSKTRKARLAASDKCLRLTTRH